MSSTRCARFLCLLIWVSTVTTALSGSSTYPASGRSLFYSFDTRKTIKKKKKKKERKGRREKHNNFPLTFCFLHLLDVHSTNNTGQKLWKNSSFFHLRGPVCNWVKPDGFPRQTSGVLIVSSQSGLKFYFVDIYLFPCILLQLLRLMSRKWRPYKFKNNFWLICRLDMGDYMFRLPLVPSCD